MPNKPDKFGVKMWVLADVKSKYCINYIPCLGSQDKDERGVNPLGYVVVQKLMESYFNLGYNVCTDNFFISAPLANFLLRKKTTIVGTLCPTSKSVTRDMLKKKELFNSTFYKSDGKLVVVYQGREKKVTPLSTMHINPVVNSNDNKKPEIIEYYNRNKVGVDCLDAMLRLYSCKTASRRWPMVLL